MEKMHDLDQRPLFAEGVVVGRLIIKEGQPPVAPRAPIECEWVLAI